MSRKKRYEPRAPLVISGGIKAQSSLRGSGRVWWSQRWFEMLEGFRLGPRLGRGRGYAAAGQVSELEIEPGEVRAVVQGMSEEPYCSTIRCRQAEGAARDEIVARLRGEPVQVGRILAGDLPVEVEEYFRAAGVPLFLSREGDIKTQCSCPDWANPCKHLAAVFYLLGEAVAHKPLLLLELRGVGREWLVGPGPGEFETTKNTKRDTKGSAQGILEGLDRGEMGECSVGGGTDGAGGTDGTGALTGPELKLGAPRGEGTLTGGGSPDAQAHLGTVRPTSQVSGCPAGDGGLHDGGTVRPAGDGGLHGWPLATIPAHQQGVVAPLVRRLGPLPFWRGHEKFMDSMEHLYARAASRGLAVWSGEALDLRPEDERVVVKGANLRLRQNRLIVDSSLR